ncbi:MAG TPA: Rieske (2Fe-2S) protein [Polyangia bacterium]|jgi:Rieske Fe-S protein
MRDCRRNRRTFLTGTGAALAGLAVLGAAPAAAQAQPHRIAISLDKVPQIRNVGGSVVLKVQDKLLLLIRDSPTDVRALDPICTHKQCVVKYRPAEHDIKCPCHGSQYALDGRVRHGPAPRNLGAYAAVLEGDRVIVTL